MDKRIVWTGKIVGAYMLWIFIHYSSSHLYSHFCNHPSIMGFFVSPFLVNTPHCIALRWFIFHGADTINTMWILFGTWSTAIVIDKITSVNNNIIEDDNSL